MTSSFGTIGTPIKFVEEHMLVQEQEPYCIAALRYDFQMKTESLDGKLRCSGCNLEILRHWWE